MSFTRCHITHGEQTRTGRMVARREKTAEVYVVVDEKPSADGWYPVGMWVEGEPDDDAR